MEVKEIFFLILAIVFFVFMIMKSKNKSSINDKTKIKDNNSFVPIKILENDNSLKNIVDDFEIRENNAKTELEKNLGKALPNDIIWSILQNLYLESFLKNHKLFLNVAYQQGLLLQKEKKFKQAIIYYSYGLYYLICFYPIKMNPINHIIDFVTSEDSIIEMAQYKFINKIKICMNNENIDIQEFRDLSKRFIETSVLPYLTHNEFLQNVESFLIKNTNEIKESPWNQSLNNMRDEDVIKGFEFNATLMLRTPLRVLIHHKEKILDKNKELPNYAKTEGEGIWLPITKSYRELGLDIDEIPEGTCSSDLGALSPKEQELYFNFLLKFHTISESEKEVKEKISAIRNLIKIDKDFNKYYKKVSNNDKYFLEGYFGLLIRNVLPPKVSSILKENGYLLLEDLKDVNLDDLLKIDGIGKSTINKLIPYVK